MTSRPDTTPGSGETDVPTPVAAAAQEPSATPVAPVPPGDGAAPDADSAAPPSPAAEPGDGVREDAPAPAGDSPDDGSGAEAIVAARAADGAPGGATAVPAVDEETPAPAVEAVDTEPAAVAPGPAVEAPAEPVPAPEAEPERAAEPEPEAAAAAAAVQRSRGSEPEPPASLLPGHPDEAGLAARAVARGRLSHAMRPRATRAQLLAGLLCALLGFALVVQARQTQTQGLEQLRQADLVRLLDNVTNAEARAEQDLRNEQAIRDQLLSGSGSSEAAQQAAQQRLDTLGLLAGTVPATGPGIVLEISDPRRQVDSTVLLDTLEELRDGGAEVIQIGDVRVVAATAFVDDAEGVRVDGRLQTPPYRYSVIGEPQTLAKVLQIPGGVLDVLRSKGAQGRVTQPETIRIDALRPPSRPQYARPAPGGTP
jgi:uncharacterized protein YlxW (UPF0749 family)